MGSSKHNKDGKGRVSSSHAHDGGNKGHKNDKGAHNFNQGGGRKKEEIVPWGWEAQAKAERKAKAIENVAKQAAAKAAREYDPATAVAEKVVKKQLEDFKGKGRFASGAKTVAALPPAK